MNENGHQNEGLQPSAPRVSVTIRLDAGSLGVYSVTDSFILPDVILVSPEQEREEPSFEFPSQTAGQIHTSYAYH